MLERASYRELMELQEAFRIDMHERLLEKWERFGVREADVVYFLGHPVAEMTSEEHQELEEQLSRAAGKKRWILRRKDPP